MISDGDTFFGFACPSRAKCVGADYAGEVTFDPQRPRASHPVTIAHGQSFGALACPRVTQCTEVDTTQHEATFDPILPGRPGSPESSATSTATTTTPPWPARRQSLSTKAKISRSRLSP